MITEKPFMSKEEIPDLTELQDEVLEQAIEKEWTTYGEEGAAEVEKRCASSKRKKKMTKRQIQNLVQFREKDERSKESKKASLEQLRVPESKPTEDDEASTPSVEFPDEILEPDKLREVLTKDEQRFFIRRWNEYMFEHQRDFNRAEDYDTVVELILCYVHEFRILKRMKNAPSLSYDRNVDTVMHNIHNRIGNLRRDLKTRRKDRIESKETRQSQFLQVVTEIAKSGQNQGALQEVQRRLLAQEEMEDDMISRKKERIHGDTKLLP